MEPLTDARIATLIQWGELRNDWGNVPHNDILAALKELQSIRIGQRDAEQEVLPGIEAFRRDNCPHPGHNIMVSDASLPLRCPACGDFLQRPLP
jgi:hypothetical protein